MDLDAEPQKSPDQQAEASGSVPSFVKRSKPRTSGVRRRESGIPDAVSQLDAGATLASASSEQDAEQEADSASVVFRPRAAGRRSAAASTATSSSKGTPLKSRTLQNDDDDQDEAGPAFEIRRSQLNTAAKQTRAQNSVTSTPSSSRKGTPIRLSALKDVETETTSTSTPSYTSRYLAELRASTPTTKPRDGSPAPAVGSSLDPMDKLAKQVAGLDHDDELSLARSKFGDDITYDSIPSDEAIRAAKDKRAKLRAEYLRKARSSEADDFISLSTGPSTSRSVQQLDSMQADDGPHPNSRLPREEDEYGDGEEDFAEYTGATERIPIGEKAEKQYAEDQRKEMEAALNGRADDMSNGAEADDMDVDEEDEWERAQMRRNEMPSYASKQRPSREASPYRSAAIPTATPIPTGTSTSAGLKQSLRTLEQSSAAHLQVVDSATKSLAELDEAENLNKTDLVDVEAKESWFRELEEFIASLARFMDEKAPELDKLDVEATQLLAERTAIAVKARSKALKEDLALFWRVSSASVLPEEEEGDGIPSEGLIRKVERQALQQADSRTDQLSASDETVFHLAKENLADRLQNLFTDTQAPEYLDPMPLVSAEEGSGIHPRSIVSRFHEWRRKYGVEYTQLWGGLSLGQIWEFYALKEMVLWDPFRSVGDNSPGAWTSGAGELQRFAWLVNSSSYKAMSLNEAQEEVDNGDAEMPATILANVLVPRTLRLVESQAFDPWSCEHSQQATTLLQHIKSVLVTAPPQQHHVDKYQSLVKAFLNTFASHSLQMEVVLSHPPQISQDGDAVFAFLARVVQDLLANLVSFHPSCSAQSSLPMFFDLLHALIANVLIKVLEHSPSLDKVRSLIQTHVLARIPITLWLASPALARDKTWLEKYVTQTQPART